MKWEDNIKATLEKRTIKPSEPSWSALADRLDAADNKNNKKPFSWIGIAATVVGILFAITVFFNEKTTDVQKPVLVETQNYGDKPIKSLEKPSHEERLVKADQETESLEIVEKNSAKSDVIKQQNSVTPVTKQNLAFAENKKEEPLNPSEIVPQNQTLQDQKVSEIVAQIQDLKSQGQPVTDADINALLQRAEKQIAYQTIINESTRIVDANALLQDVETDLQKSFRDKIFEALKNSYETVKTTVAERNN